MHTIGLLSHTGGIGKAVLSTLLPAHKAGQVKLVVFHRSSSDLTAIPADVEKREIDLEKPDTAKLEEQVKGINVFM